MNIFQTQYAVMASALGAVLVYAWNAERKNENYRDAKLLISLAGIAFAFAASVEFGVLLR